MFSWLTRHFIRHFIPHEGNNHRPHILRGASIRNIVVILLFLEVFSFVIPTFTKLDITGNMAAVLPAVLANLTNQERQSQNLAILTTNPILVKAAEMKAQDMASKGYFAHTSPEGKTPWYWLQLAGYQYQYAGENLAINFSDSKDVTDAWMASPTHKANIVKGNYTEVGTGIATGIYEGQETVFVAQVYANPMSKAIERVGVAKIVKKVETKPTPVAVEPKINILGEETVSNIGNNPGTIVIDKVIVIDKTPKPTFLQTLFASPRNTTNIILYFVFGVIALALFLYITIKMRNHHIDLITNGLAVLAIVFAIFIANSYLSNRNMVLLDSFNYSNESL